MKKNKLFKQDNNQSTKQVSVTMQDSRIVACNLTKNKLTLRNLPSTQNTKYRTPFFPVHPSGTYSEYTNTASYYLYKLNNFAVMNCSHQNIGTVKVKI